MRITVLLVFSCILLCAAPATAQQVPFNLPLTVTHGSCVRILQFGFAPEATDGQDLQLGEFELPPAPPEGAFDVRFALPGTDLQGQRCDYRQGTALAAPPALFRLRFQPADGSPIVFACDLPPGVRGRLVDPLGGIVVNHAMAGRSNFELTRTALGELHMEIFWSERDAAVEEQPSSVALEQNYPNPFNPSTTFRYAVPVAGPVTLRIYDVVGREVATLVEGMRGAGRHSIAWDAAGAAGGVYFSRLTAGGVTATRRIVLLK